jgi:hypothetical protein
VQADRICRQWSEQAGRLPDPFNARDITTARRRYADIERPALRALDALRRLKDRTRSPESVERFISLHMSFLEGARRELETRVLNNRGEATPQQFERLLSSVAERRRERTQASRAARGFGAAGCAGTD